MTKKFKFGDIVINHFAGDANPSKIFMVTSHVGNSLNGISRSGRKCALRISNA